MNINRKHITHMLAAAASVLLATAPAFAQGGASAFTTTSSGDSSGGLTVVASEPLDGDDAANVKSETFEVRVENGEVSVRQNGKDVPQARIQQKNGQVVILDENGNELKTIRLGLFNEPGGFFYRLGSTEAGNTGAATPRFYTGRNALRGINIAEAGDDGQAPKVMIGVHMGEPGPALEKHLHLKSGKCTIITGVFEGLPAEQAGVGEYDVIVAIDGSNEAGAESIRDTLQGKEPGDTVKLRVIQAGEEKEITLKLQQYDAERMHAAKLLGQAAGDGLGGGLMPFQGQFPENLQDWNIAVPEGMQRHLWVTPGGEWKGALPQFDQLNLEGLQNKWQELEPMIQQQLHDALKKYHAEAGEGGVKAGDNADVEKQLDRLDERLDQLEKMLQKLIEKQAKP